MSSSGQEPFCNRRALQEQIQRRILHQEQECATLFEDMRHAQRALLAAKAVVEAAEFEHARIAEQLSLARRRRTMLQHELANLAIEVVPTEIWQAVFVHVIDSYPITIPFSKAVYDGQRTMAPFRLSAVCRRWREVALQTSELWTYVALPSYGFHASIALDCLLPCLIERSKPRPIDVLFPFTDNYDASRAWKHCMPCVVGEFHRWRRVKINLPHGSGLDHSFLQCDAPLLSEVHLGWANGYDEQALVTPTALSASQALRALHAPASLLSPQMALSNMSSLGIVLDVSPDLALQVIGQMPTLLELTIAASDKDDSSLSSEAIRAAPVRLTRLRALTLFGHSEPFSALLSSLQAPNLRHLVLNPCVRHGLSEATMHMLRDKFSSIETLVFDARVDDAHAWGIGEVLHLSSIAFPNLRHLTLSNCYFWMLRVNYAVVWPALESITLRGRTAYSAADYGCITTFLGLAACSAETEADRTGGDTPHRANFQLFVRDLSPVPAWLPRHLARIVGPENTHVFGPDGKEIPLGVDDDACFTDSEDAASSSASSRSSSGAVDDHLLTVDGSDWASDDSEDDPSWKPEGSTPDDDEDAPDGRDDVPGHASELLRI